MPLIYAHFTCPSICYFSSLMASLTHMFAIALFISYYTPTILVLGKQRFLKDCPPLRCSKHGPIVRFPFRLDSHAPHCGYDTLILSCSGGNTVLTLPSSGDYNVTSIDYKKSMLAITRYSWTLNCSWSQIAEPNVIGSLFIRPFPVDVSWLDCSDHGSRNRPIPSQLGRFNSESDWTGPSFTRFSRLCEFLRKTRMNSDGIGRFSDFPAELHRVKPS